MDPEERSHVSNFTLYNEHGQVMWEGDTDIRGIDFSKTVHIVNKSIEVYPDDVEKPALGFGLNKPAVLTLRIQKLKS